MEVEVQSTRTSRKVEVITGVTNYDGITRSKNIDEKMELQFTSAFTVQQIKALGANGAEWSGAIHNPIQILNQSKPASYSPNHASNGTISMRPEDLFVRQTRNEEIDDLARSMVTSTCVRVSRVGHSRPHVAVTPKHRSTCLPH